MIENRSDNVPRRMISIYLYENCLLLLLYLEYLSKPTAKRKDTQFRSVYYNVIDIMRLNSDRRAPKLPFLRLSFLFLPATEMQVI